MERQWDKVEALGLILQFLKDIGFTVTAAACEAECNLNGVQLPAGCYPKPLLEMLQAYETLQKGKEDRDKYLKGVLLNQRETNVAEGDCIPSNEINKQLMYEMLSVMKYFAPSIFGNNIQLNMAQNNKIINDIRYITDRNPAPSGLPRSSEAMIPLTLPAENASADSHSLISQFNNVSQSPNIHYNIAQQSNSEVSPHNRSNTQTKRVQKPNQLNVAPNSTTMQSLVRPITQNLRNNATGGTQSLQHALPQDTVGPNPMNAKTNANLTRSESANISKRDQMQNKKQNKAPDPIISPRKRKRNPIRRDQQDNGENTPLGMKQLIPIVTQSINTYLSEEPAGDGLIEKSHGIMKSLRAGSEIGPLLADEPLGIGSDPMSLQYSPYANLSLLTPQYPPANDPANDYVDHSATLAGTANAEVEPRKDEHADSDSDLDDCVNDVLEVIHAK